MTVRVKRTGGGIERLNRALKRSRGQRLDIVIDNQEAARYASYIEHGWIQKVTPKQAKYLNYISGGHGPKVGSLLVNPPRPLFASTYAAHLNDWRNLFRRSVRKHGIANTAEALRDMGRQAVQDFRETIDTGGESSGVHFAGRAPLTLQIRSNLGKDTSEMPLVDTGTLRRSIKYKVNGK